MRLLKEIRNLMGNYHVKSGIYLYYRNEFKQAVDFFRRALRDGEEINESDRRTARFYLTQTFVQSAERQIQKNDLDAAIRDFARAIEVSPDAFVQSIQDGLLLLRPGPAGIEGVGQGDRYRSTLSDCACLGPEWIEVPTCRAWVA